MFSFNRWSLLGSFFPLDLPTGQTVAGVEVAQVTLGMDLLGLDDLERGKE